jgi:hypothetical protein
MEAVIQRTCNAKGKRKGQTIINKILNRILKIAQHLTHGLRKGKQFLSPHNDTRHVTASSRGYVISTNMSGMTFNVVVRHSFMLILI